MGDQCRWLSRGAVRGLGRALAVVRCVSGLPVRTDVVRTALPLRTTDGVYHTEQGNWTWRCPTCGATAPAVIKFGNWVVSGRAR